MKKQISPKTTAKLEEIWQNERHRLIIRANAKTALEVINGELTDETFIDAIPDNLHLLGQSKEKDEKVIARFYRKIENQIDSVETSGLVAFSCGVGYGHEKNRQMLFFDEHIGILLKESGYRVTQFIIIDSGEYLAEIESSSAVILYYTIIMATRIDNI